MSEAKIMDGLRRAAKRRKAADGERHAASVELRKRVQDAHAAGIGPTRIAEAAGLSRQAVYEALGHQQPS
jgi:DNA invertase Pin-like site-specific DNA recombinase